MFQVRWVSLPLASLLFLQEFLLSLSIETKLILQVIRALTLPPSHIFLTPTLFPNVFLESSLSCLLPSHPKPGVLSGFVLLLWIHPQRIAHFQNLAIGTSWLHLPLALVFLYVHVWTRLQALWGRTVFYVNIDKEDQKEDDKEEGMSFSSAIYRNWIWKNCINFEQHNHKTTAYFRIHTNGRCESKEVTPGTCDIETWVCGPENAFLHFLITKPDIIRHSWIKLKESISQYTQNERYVARKF